MKIFEKFNQLLFNFLDNSPTPFHAVKNQADMLEENSFQRLYEADKWELEPGKAYYVTRNDSSIIAFVFGKKPVVETGIRMLGAHTDSPCLKLKPNAEIVSQSYLQLGVEVYGGALLNPWFDRDLSLAGRVVYKADKVTGTKVKSCLLDFKQPVAIIPSLAIHLDREANKNHTINPQTDIVPLLLQPEGKEKFSLSELLKQQIIADYPYIAVHEILDFELSFYNTQKAAYVGINQDFIASSRLDNLLSCFVATQAMIKADRQGSVLMVCNDHEEVGSASASGAQGPFLKSVLERLVDSRESYTRMIDQSMLISADNAHGIHPNFADRHDANHGPLLNHGPVIKTNCNQRYASNSDTIAIVRVLAKRARVPLQSFVIRTDMACGSTIGPVTAAETGVKTLDIGVPTFAMHSIRELCGSKDSYSLFKLMEQFFKPGNSIFIETTEA